MATHILYVLDRFPVPSQTFVTNEISELRRRGVTVSVMTSRPPYRYWTPEIAIDSPGVRINRWWLRLLPRLFRLARKQPRSALRFLRYLTQAPKGDVPFALAAPLYLDGLQQIPGVTAVHCHFAFRAATFAASLAELIDVPWSITTHANDLFVETKHLRRRLRNATVLTISDYNKKFLWSLGINSTTVRCGVDIAKMNKLESWRPTGEIDVIFVGRMVQKKGLSTLLAAAEIYAQRYGCELRIGILGAGPEDRELRSALGTKKLNVSLIGTVTPEETWAHIAQSRCICLPCRVADDGDMDGIPVVLMEAMAIGTPVVTTSISGIPELVDSSSGWIVPTAHESDPWALASLLRDCLRAEGAELERRTRGGRSAVGDAYTLRGQVDALLRVLGERTAAAK